jgi:two-component system, NarL family, sensor histidine kinase BarA
MSYRSFKRVLGETSLERKCRFLFGVCLLVLIAVSFVLHGRLTEGLVYQQNPTRGRLIVDTALALRHWERFEPEDSKFRPVIQDMTATWQANKFNSSFIRPDKVAAGTQAVDDFERDFLRQAVEEPPAVDVKPGSDEDEKPVFFKGRLLDGGRQYEYYQAVYAATSCVHCHRDIVQQSTLRDGDLIAVAKVGISNGPTQAKINLNRAFLLSSAIVTVFLAMVASWVIIRYVIVKPLKHLREVSEEVGRGDLAQRVDIRTGDEFESLATAFNRMLQHLGETQREIREANRTLDAKVDELAQVNMRLFELNRLKSDFLATMSHELRTPLNSIIGFSEVLGSIDSLDDKQKRYVQNIRKSGKVLLDMINDILDLAKMESGKMELRPTEFAVEHVVQAQCDSVRPLSEKKNIDLNVQIEGAEEPIYQDQNKLQQILNNLLSNAIKFTPEGGRIDVKVRRNPGGEFELRVADTGIGIAEEDQAAVFEKFRQGTAVLGDGDVTTREHTGTGLGLSIVKELCRLLGGEVTLASELGKGSEFTVVLPWQYRVSKTSTPFNESIDGLSLADMTGGRATRSPSQAVGET